MAGDALLDAYQEVLDLAVYLRQALEEKRVGPADRRNSKPCEHCEHEET